MLFERKQYLQRLVHGQGNGMVKIVTGIRRCGKSYLLFNIFRQYLLDHGTDADHIICLSLDDHRNQSLTQPDTLLSYIDAHTVQDGRLNYVILDEVQLVEDFVGVLLSLMHTPNMEVYVSGSNSKFLSSDVVTEFRGRGWEIHVQPLSFAEYYAVAGGDKQEALNQYYTYGGLPQVYAMPTPYEKEQYLKNLYETTYLRDVIDRNHLQNAEGMRQLIQVLASDIGASTNPRRIANTFLSEERIAIKDTTIRKYIDYLQNAFIIHEALRYDVKGRKYIGTETKYYFEDMGLRNAIINFRQVEFNHVMENVLYNELRMRGYSVDVGAVQTYEKDKNGKTVRKNLEVDFVVNRGSERVYIQSAYMLPDYEKTLQEQRPLLHLPDNFSKVIIVGDRYYSHYNDGGIRIVGLFDFLLNEEETLQHSTVLHNIGFSQRDRVLNS